MTTPLGIIEGFYGQPWSWQARADLVSFLAPHGYGFYIYAPKADPFLRRRWQEPHPPEMTANLKAFAAHCRQLGVRFGVGLSPYELYQNFDDGARIALKAKLAFLDDIGVQDLAILFDDMRGDTPDLADRQVEIMHWIQAESGAEKLMICPSYYSDDPVLDRVFGDRPAGYLERLGASLSSDIDIFWTGEEVCSREISPGHLRKVGTLLHRKPLLWDNYPVNDGQRMSQHLHLKGFTGRPAAIGPHLSGHMINPALQPTLTCIPALTLADSYLQGDDYCYAASFRRAAEAVLGAELAALVEADIMALQDVGLDQLGPREERLRKHYAGSQHPGAREIMAWLDGGYRITDEIVQTQ